MWQMTRPDAVAVLEDEMARKSLRRYVDVLQDIKSAKFVLAKTLSAEFDESASLENLWEEHASLMDGFQVFERLFDEGKKLNGSVPPTKSYLDLKIAIANRIVRSCRFCTRQCGVNRLMTGLGYCGCGGTMAVSSIFAHIGEE